MKEVSELLPSNNQLSNRVDQFAQVNSSDLTVEQKGAIKYFYARLQRIYLAEYRRQLPDESTERASKREFSPLIMNISKEVMDKGFEALHEARMEPDSDYIFMNLDAVIGVVSSGGGILCNGVTWHDKQAHRYFDESTALPEPEDAKRKRKKIGSDALADMLAGFE